MMMKEMAVFIHTTLNTHIAVSISPDTTTAGDLKRELGNEHHICFPSIGVIKINGLMVKRKSHYFHLPDFILVKNVFQGPKRTWFLHADVAPLHHSDNPFQLESYAAKSRKNINGGSDIADSGVLQNNIRCKFELNTEGKALQREKEECMWPKNNLETNVNDGSDVADSRKCEKVVTCKFQLKTKKIYLEREREECMWSEGTPNTNQMSANIPEKDKKRNRKKCSPKEVLDGNERFVHVHNKSHLIFRQEQSFHCDIRKEMNQGRQITLIPAVESLTVSVSEVPSVTNLIRRYFAEFDEVESFNAPPSSGIRDESRVCGSNQGFLHKSLKDKKNEHRPNVGTRNTPQCTDLTPPRPISFPPPTEQTSRASSRNFRKPEVGKRILVAANHLGNSASKKKSLITLSQFKNQSFEFP